MKNNPKKTASGTNVEEVKTQLEKAAEKEGNPGKAQYGTEFGSEANPELLKQSAKAAQAQQDQGQYGTEFASETNAQEVKQQNKKSKKNRK